MEFNQIALQKLVQVAPELANLVIAFRDISEEASSEQDTTVGVFILRSGSGTFFIPVIRKDQTVHPIDSVFCADIAQFRPLSRSLITQIINAQTSEMGSSKKIPANVVRNPSVYDLVNPPRTGKYVYASETRLLEFLAAMPGHLKDHVRHVVTSDTSLASGLSKVVGLKDLIDALKSSPVEPKKVEEVPAAVFTYGDALSDAQAREVMEKGYSINKEYPHGNRIGIAEDDFNVQGTFHQLSAQTEGGKCYRIIAEDGNVVAGYVVPGAKTGSFKSPRATVILLENGKTIVGDNSLKFVAVGDELPSDDTHSAMKSILEKFTRITPLVTLSEALVSAKGKNVIALSPDFEVIAQGYPNSVTINPTEVQASMTGAEGYRIIAIKGLSNFICEAGGPICVPETWPAIIVESNCGCTAAVNVNAAQRLLQTRALQSLGDRLDIMHDGVDFAINGANVGPAHKALHILIVNEGFEPEVAESFIKKASEQRKCRVLMSKKADFEPGVIPQFGNPPPPQNPDVLTPAARQALQAGDKQVAEAMIISELLQAPELYEVVSEYLPDIGTAVDKLGRILFLARARMDQLVETVGNESAMSTIASVKSVYRSLGDNLVKLEQLSTNVTSAK